MSDPADLFPLLPAFLAAARQQSFSRAARELNVTPAAVSKNIRQLEHQLGQVLFVRNTHQVVLTPEGAALQSRVGPAWQALHQALENPDAEPSGTVRLSVIPGFGRYRLMPILAGFQECYPRIRLDIVMETRHANLLTDRTDIAIGHSSADDARLIARPIAPMQMLFAASPGYLLRAGTPTRVGELIHHRCLMHRHEGNGQCIPWRDEQQQVIDLEQATSLISTYPEALVDAAIDGMGIINLADWYIRPHLASGHLQAILPAASHCPRAMWVKYPPHPLAPRVRVLVDFLMQQFNS